MYFNLLPLLQSSFEPLVQCDVGGQLSLAVSHSLSDPRLLSIICLPFQENFACILQSTIFLFVSVLFYSSRGEAQLSLVLISCLYTSWEIFPSMLSQSLNYYSYDNNSKHSVWYLLCVRPCSQCIHCIY